MGMIGECKCCYYIMELPPRLSHAWAVPSSEHPATEILNRYSIVRRPWISNSRFRMFGDRVSSCRPLVMIMRLLVRASPMLQHNTTFIDISPTTGTTNSIQSDVSLSGMLDFALSIAACCLAWNFASCLCKGLYSMLHSLHSVNPFSSIARLNVVWTVAGLEPRIVPRPRPPASNFFGFVGNRLRVSGLVLDNTSVWWLCSTDSSSTVSVWPLSSSASVSPPILESSDVARDITRVVSLRRFFRGKLGVGDDGGVFVGIIDLEDGSDG